MTIDTTCDRRITALSPVEPRSLLGWVVHEEFDAVGAFVGKLLAPTENCPSALTVNRNYQKK